MGGGFHLSFAQFAVLIYGTIIADGDSVVCDTSGKHWERTRKMGINSPVFRLPQHETFWIADADCVGLRSDIPWEQNRQWLDVLARSGTALFVSADPAAVGPAQKAALRDAFAVAARPAPPAASLDWLDTTSPRVWRFGNGEATYDWHPFPGSAFACPPRFGKSQVFAEFCCIMKRKDASYPILCYPIPYPKKPL